MVNKKHNYFWITEEHLKEWGFEYLYSNNQSEAIYKYKWAKDDRESHLARYGNVIVGWLGDRKLKQTNVQSKAEFENLMLDFTKEEL